MEFFPSAVLKSRIVNKVLRLLHRSYPSSFFRRFGEPGGPPLLKHGSDYGGWFVPTSIQNDWVVYSLGIGQDTTFDTAIIEKYGVTVHGFDPTPAAAEHVERCRRESTLFAEKFSFSPVGLWDSDRVLQFYEPKTRGWVGSYSALNLQGTNKSIDVPCKTLVTLMQERHHNHVDLLKMDIEGAEYRVLDTILAEKIQIHWLCVEFDQPVPIRTTERAIRRLGDAGFVLRHVDQWNFTFENLRYAGSGHPSV